MLRQRGFTLVELMVVMALVALLVVLLLMNRRPFTDGYYFSNAIRGLHNTMTMTRIRAMQYKHPTMLYVVPSSVALPAITTWTLGQAYVKGTDLRTSSWVKIPQYTGSTLMRTDVTFICLQNHVAAADTEPLVGEKGGEFWAAMLDFAYNKDVVTIWNCTGAASMGACRDADPGGANYAPLTIQFNTRGFSRDYASSVVLVEGSPDLQAGHPGSRLMISPLGTIELRGTSGF